MQFLKTVHKWTSVLVGIQFLLWLISGFYFNIMDTSVVGGNQYRNSATQLNSHFVLKQNSAFIEPEIILNQFKAKNLNTQAIKVVSLLGQPFYLVTHKKGLRRYFPSQYSLVDVYTGKIKKLNSELVKNIALTSYNGPGKVVSSVKLTPPINDLLREQNPVWQVNFSDSVETSVYIDAGTGAIVSHVDDDKRFADFFWMIHFMDYGKQGGFNSWHLILFALVTLLLCLSGLFWTIDKALAGQYRISFSNKKRGIDVNNADGTSLGKLAFPLNQNILDALLEHDVVLPSSCGGGGSCGQCKVNIGANAIATSADLSHFSAQELSNGFRLACQHSCSTLNELTILQTSNAKKLTLKLSKSTFISPFIKELRFKTTDNSTLNFKAGAYMRFTIPAATGHTIPQQLPPELATYWQHIEPLDYQHQDCSKCYSFANYDTQGDELVFTVKMQTAPAKNMLPGIASSYICNLPVGETIEAIGPFEDFNAITPSQKHMIMIGAGAGMAPLKSIILEQLEKFKSTRTLRFYFGARHQVDLIYQQLFDDLAQKHSNFSYTPVLSRADQNWQGATGYVQQVIEDSFTEFGSVDNLEFYICGPKSMMAETIDMLKNNGVPENAILFDDFS